MTRLILITGCSGGGKSTLLEALNSAGHAVVAEPGRRIVAEETARGGAALPWIDMAAFARRAVERSKSDLLEAQKGSGLVFFDRGLIDAAVALHHVEGIPLEDTLEGSRPYSNPVFLAPPWPELFENDRQRRHGFDDAGAEYERLEQALRQLDYRTVLRPREPVEKRLQFVLNGRDVFEQFQCLLDVHLQHISDRLALETDL